MSNANPMAAMAQINHCTGERRIFGIVWRRIYYAAMNLETERAALDAHVREIIDWHFDPKTGSPFWLDFGRTLKWDPKREVKTFADLSRFPPFEDEWLRGGPLDRWIPKGYDGKPVFVF